MTKISSTFGERTQNFCRQDDSLSLIRNDMKIDINLTNNIKFMVPWFRFLVTDLSMWSLRLECRIFLMQFELKILE
jgi:hypothetical protein